VAIDNIAAATNSFSPLLTSVGFSGLTGFLVGFAIKKVMKILAIGAGIFFAALMYLESQNIVNINWDKLQNASQNAVSTLTNAAGQFPLIGRATFEPGWSWDKCVKPLVGTNSCQAPHTSYIISGRMKVRMDDGSEIEGGPGDTAVIPSGHNAWVVGNEPCIMNDFTGAKDYAKGGTS
jgi:uncharacterized membrane protein (Fun14 family)